MLQKDKIFTQYHVCMKGSVRGGISVPESIISTNLLIGVSYCGLKTQSSPTTATTIFCKKNVYVFNPKRNINHIKHKHTSDVNLKSNGRECLRANRECFTSSVKHDSANISLLSLR